MIPVTHPFANNAKGWGTRRKQERSPPHNLSRFNRNELVITETELKLIAAAARIGLNSRPKNG
jgi:hypothetical protein